MQDFAGPSTGISVETWMLWAWTSLHNRALMRFTGDFTENDKQRIRETGISKPIPWMFSMKKLGRLMYFFPCTNALNIASNLSMLGSEWQAVPSWTSKILVLLRLQRFFEPRLFYVILYIYIYICYIYIYICIDLCKCPSTSITYILYIYILLFI